MSNAGSRVTPSSARRLPMPSSSARRRTVSRCLTINGQIVRQRAARIDEGHHQDAAGKPSHASRGDRSDRAARRVERRRQEGPVERPAPLSPPLPAAVIFTSSIQLRLFATTSVASMRSPCRNPGVAPLTSNGMVIAGISPFTASWETTTRAGDGSKPTTVPVSGYRRVSPDWPRRTRREQSPSASSLERESPPRSCPPYLSFSFFAAVPFIT